MNIQDTEYYNNGLNDFLEDGIDYNANTIYKADKGDLQQLAVDSFHAGYLHANKETSIGQLKKERDQYRELWMKSQKLKKDLIKKYNLPINAVTLD